MVMKKIGKIHEEQMKWLRNFPDVNNKTEIVVTSDKELIEWKKRLKSKNVKYEIRAVMRNGIEVARRIIF